ncbi:MAG: phosphatase PAP2 family protein [Actinomycetota bacterium]
MALRTLREDPRIAAAAPRRRLGRERALVLAGGALVVALATIRGRGRTLDERLFGWANGRLHHPALDTLFRDVTEMGSLWASAAAAGAMAAGGRRREATDALGAATAMWALGQGLKRAFRRLRPYESERPGRLVIGRPRGASWPSSHPATLLAFVSVAGRDLGLSRGSRRALTGLAGVVGASRVYLGVHYPADVVGGLLLGRAVAEAWSRAVSPRVLG